MNLKQAEVLIEQQLPPILYSVTQKIIEHGYQIFLVGGFIRDILLQRNIQAHEYDLTTNATPDDLKKIFGRVIPTGIKHGTISILRDDILFEITTFRSDGKYSDGRHPDSIKFAQTIEEDLSRRDFTINALAYDLHKRHLVDQFNGLQDLQDKIIRTIGNPDERFQEDGLRLLRAIRFATVLHFAIDEQTLRSINKNLFMLNKVAMERIKDEFVKILQSDKPSMGIELMRQTEILRKLIPELLTGFGMMQNRFHKHDVYYHLLYSCDAAPPHNVAIRLAALFHDLCKPSTKSNKEDKENATFYNHDVLSALVTKKILKRMKFSNEMIEQVEKLVGLHMFYYTDEWTDSAVRRFLRKAGLEQLDNLFLLREADRVGNGMKEEHSKHIDELKKRIQKVIDEENAFTIKHLKVDGCDVMRVKNIPPSPLIGKILNYLLEKVLDDSSLNSKEKLEELIREYTI